MEPDLESNVCQKPRICSSWTAGCYTADDRHYTSGCKPETARVGHPHEPKGKEADICNSNHTESRRTGDNSTEISTLTSIKRGTFTVPMLFPQQQSSKCLARGNESRAWQCAFDTRLQLSILPSPSADAAEPVMITLGLPSTSNSSVHCGQQAPEIGPTAMTAINGSNDGSQYHFSASYDRVVILGADQLGQEKTAPSPMQGQSKHTTFLPGQSVWRCTFANTRLEGFIYARRERDPASNVTDPVPAASAQLPYSLKLLEQRSVDGSAPYCEKVVVGSGGSLQGSNEKVDLELSETQVGSKDEADTSCQCQWVVE